MKARRYRIELTREADRHLVALGTPERYEPTVETRNRKRLRPNPVAPWELRIGRVRVYFEVEDEPRLVVRILAVGDKVRNRVRIGGEEVELR